MKKVNEGSRCTYTVNSTGVALMEINNPPMNALSWSVLDEIRDTLFAAIHDEEVRVIVFTGAGKAFIAGADISELNDFTTAKEGAESLINGQELSNFMMQADKPIIAAINGFCLGGGMEMALACHIRLADETATLGLPEIKLGIIPGYGGTQRTPRLIGRARALELILSGNFISGRQAEAYGLVNRAVPKGTVIPEAMKLAEAISSKSRIAVGAAIQAVGEGSAMDLHAGMKLEREMFGICYASEDKKEGAAAFMEKRVPKFKDK
ncbi:MAG: enoyl-CoA hydratase-related protein [Smithella sp.]